MKPIPDISNKLSVKIWRWSVCAGDDFNAPNEITMSLSSDMNLGDFILQIANSNYLPHNLKWSLFAPELVAIMEGSKDGAILTCQRYKRLGDFKANGATPIFEFRQVDEIGQRKLPASNRKHLISQGAKVLNVICNRQDNKLSYASKPNDA